MEKIQKEVKISGKINSLPLDLEYKILTPLPLKQLYSLKRVCKHWLHLISSQPFLKLHRQLHASPNNSEGTILLIDRPVRGSIIFSYDLHTDVLRNLYCYASKAYYWGLIGSCNGLLCFQDYLEVVFVHNPLTEACKEITRPAKTFTEWRNTDHITGPCYWIKLLGFGYDCFSDDYKLLSIHKVWVYGDKTSSLKEAYIYSFKARSWKVVINKLMYRGLHYNRDRFCSENGAMTLTNNNTLHWLICSCSENDYHQKCAVACFDIQTEEHREIQAPDGMNTSYDESRVNLSSLASCLHILHSTKDLSRMEVWVMKEYGVELSWTRVFQCSLIDQLQDVSSSSSLLEGISGIPFPCAYSEDGQEIVVALQTRTMNFVSCDLQRQQVSSVQPLTGYQKFSIQPWKGLLDSPIHD